MTKKNYIIAREVDTRKVLLVFRQHLGFISIEKIAGITGIDSRRVLSLLKNKMGFMFKPWFILFG